MHGYMMTKLLPEFMDVWEITYRHSDASCNHMDYIFS